MNDRFKIISQLLLEEINDRFNKEPPSFSDIEWSDNFAENNICNIIENVITTKE